MNREEILAKAQKENKNIDLVNLKIMADSERLAGGIAGIICFMLYVAEKIITGNKNHSLLGIFSAFVAVSSFGCDEPISGLLLIGQFLQRCTLKKLNKSHSSDQKQISKHGAKQKNQQSFLCTDGRFFHKKIPRLFFT